MVSLGLANLRPAGRGYNIADHHKKDNNTNFCFTEMAFRLFGGPYLVEDVLATNVGLLIITIYGIITILLWINMQVNSEAFWYLGCDSIVRPDPYLIKRKL